MTPWAGSVAAITLFVEDLAAAREFYGTVFGVSEVFADEESTAYRFGGLVVNLLCTAAAPELISPAVVAPAEAGSRLQLTIPVDDVDATCGPAACAGRDARQRADRPSLGAADRLLRRPGWAPVGDRPAPCHARRGTVARVGP